jgi:hypothetical protein
MHEHQTLQAGVLAGEYAEFCASAQRTRVPVPGHGAHAEAGVFAHTSRPSIAHAHGRWWARRWRRAGGRLNAG